MHVTILAFWQDFFIVFYSYQTSQNSVYATFSFTPSHLRPETHPISGNFIPFLLKSMYSCTCGHVNRLSDPCGCHLRKSSFELPRFSSVYLFPAGGDYGGGAMENKYSANKAYRFVNLSLLQSVICVGHLVFLRQWGARMRWTCKWDVWKFVHSFE